MLQTSSSWPPFLFGVGSTSPWREPLPSVVRQERSPPLGNYSRSGKIAVARLPIATCSNGRGISSQGCRSYLGESPHG
jgi:hypothetical protein